MRPTGNSQGGYYFYSLQTGRILNRNHWTELPMPAEVITRVEQLVAGNLAAGLSFTNRHGQVNNDDDDDDEDDDDD
ncbi:MAG TPA: hypothetical protein V6D20_08560 [Candidatus Obscuribacterales bacterium]